MGLFLQEVHRFPIQMYKAVFVTKLVCVNIHEATESVCSVSEDMSPMWAANGLTRLPITSPFLRQSCAAKGVALAAMHQLDLMATSLVLIYTDRTELQDLQYW